MASLWPLWASIYMHVGMSAHCVSMEGIRTGIERIKRHEVFTASIYHVPFLSFSYSFMPKSIVIGQHSLNETGSVKLSGNGCLEFAVKGIV